MKQQYSNLPIQWSSNILVFLSYILHFFSPLDGTIPIDFSRALTRPIMSIMCPGWSTLCQTVLLYCTIDDVSTNSLAFHEFSFLAFYGSVKTVSSFQMWDFLLLCLYQQSCRPTCAWSTWKCSAMLLQQLQLIWSSYGNIYGQLIN